MFGIKNIFGIENPEKYLEKFFDFETKLDLGKTSEKFMEKNADYISLFDYNLFPFVQPVEECLSELFKEIDIRTQEHLMNRVIITHKMLFSDKKDCTFMCMEVLIAVMIGYYQYDMNFEKFSSTDTLSFSDIFASGEDRKIPAFTVFFERKFKEAGIEEGGMSQVINSTLKACNNLYSKMLYAWCQLHEKYLFFNPELLNFQYPGFYMNYEDLKKFAQMFRMIS